MKVKDSCSSGLHSWSSFLKWIGTFCVIGAIIAWFMEGPGWPIMATGISCILVGVLFKGLYPISYLSEHKLAELGDTDFREEDPAEK